MQRLLYLQLLKQKQMAVEVAIHSILTDFTSSTCYSTLLVKSYGSDTLNYNGPLPEKRLLPMYKLLRRWSVDELAQSAGSVPDN